jgi:hypothetical protein
MASVKPYTSRQSVMDGGMIGLLGQVDASLGELKLRASEVMALQEPADPDFCPLEMQALCRILDMGRHRIARRISELGGPADPGADEAYGEPRLPENVADPMAFMGGYRDCCRKLCKALDKSLQVSDGATGALLSDLGLRMEKQLWLLDTPPNSRGADYSSRSVSLFLAC